MPKIIAFAVAAVALAVAGMALAGSSAKAVYGSSATSVYSYRAVMTRGAEVPKPHAPASAKGLFTATVTETGSARTIRWKLTFRGLSGRAVAAHVHRGKAGASGGVLFALCGPCKSGQTGSAKVSKSRADALERGLAYVNVHTGKNAAGEIRGQAKLVGHDERPAAPDPGATTTTPDDGAGGGGEDGY